MFLPFLPAIRSFIAETTKLYFCDTGSFSLIVKNLLPFSSEIYPDAFLMDKYN